MAIVKKFSTWCEHTNAVLHNRSEVNLLVILSDILWDLRVDGCVILLCPDRNYDAKNVSCYVLQGVMMSHRNIVSTIVGVTASVPKLSTNDIYLAYLPLAHILELTGEVMNPCDIGMQGLGNLF